MIKILNISNPFKYKSENYVYIGRKKSGMHFGNPFSSKEESLAVVNGLDNKTAVKMFDEWIREENYLEIEPERRKWILEQINNGFLDDKILVCYKHGGFCHGEIYKKIVDNRKMNDLSQFLNSK